MTIKQLIEKRAREYNIAKDLRDRAASQNRLMDEDEKRQWQAAIDAFDAYTEQIEAEERMAAIEAEREAKDTRTVEQKVDTRSAEEKYEEFFWNEMRYGNGLSMAEAKKLLSEFRSTTTVLAANDASTTFGSYLVPITLWTELERTMKQFGGMLDACRLLNTSDGGTLNWPTNDDTTSTGAWLDEPRASALTVENPTFSRKQYSGYTWGTLAKVTIEMLQDERVNLLPEVLTSMLGERAGRALNLAFTLGNGSGKPTGLLDSSNGAATGKTTASATAITKAEIFDLLHSVDPAYRVGPNVGFMFNDSTLNAIRQLDISTNTAPIWQPSFTENVPNRIAGYRYWINQDFPSIAAEQDVCAFGDFSKYIIRQVARPTLMPLNERFMDELHRGYVMWCRYDGKLLNSSAIKLLTMKTA